MRMNRYWYPLFLGILWIWPLSLQAQSVVIKLATLAPEGSFWMKQLRAWDARIQRRTHGRVKFRFYAGGVAGEEKAVIEKIEYGQLQGAAFAGTGLGIIQPRIRILEIPYFYQSAEEWEYVLQHLVPDLKKGFARKGYVLLGWGKAGFAYLYSRDPIRNFDDFRAAKVWVYAGDPLVESCFHALRAHGVPLGATEVMTSLQRGVINCVYSPPYALILMRWHSYVRYCADCPLVQVIGGILITRKTMRKISRRYRKIILQEARRMAGKISRLGRQKNLEATTLLKEKYGVKYIPVDSSWTNQTQQLAKDIAQSQVGKLYSRELLERVKKLQAEFRSRH